MALQKTIALSSVQVANAYHQVLRVASGRDGALAIKLGTFRSQTEATAYKVDPKTADPPLKVWAYTLTAFDKAGANAHTQAYTYLKTLSEWSDATDV
jgi:hypothetical protein